MATAQLVNQILDGVDYSEIELIEPKVLVSDFRYLPAPIYVRGSIDTSDETYEYYRSVLSSLPLDGKGDVVFRITDPLTYVVLTEDQISENDEFAEFEPNTKYLVNGNNRVATLDRTMSAETAVKYQFSKAPVQQVTGKITPELLRKLQINSNDTTRSHNTLQKQRMIADQYQKCLDVGYKKSKAVAYTCAMFNGLSESEVSNAITLIGSEHANDLSEMIDRNILASTTAVRLVQFCEKLNLQPMVAVEMILKEKGLHLNSEPEKSVNGRVRYLLSREQVAEFFKAYQKATDAEPTEGSEGSETDEATDKASKNITSDDVIKAKKKINDVLQAVIRINESPVKESEFHLVHDSLPVIGALLKDLLSATDVRKCRSVYETVASTMLSILQDGSVMSNLDESELVKISTRFSTIANKFLLPVLKQTDFVDVSTKSIDYDEIIEEDEDADADAAAIAAMEAEEDQSIDDIDSVEATTW